MSGTPKRFTGQERRDLIAWLAKHYDDGASIRDLMRMAQLNYWLTHRLLTEGKVKMRPRGGTNHHAKQVQP